MSPNNRQFFEERSPRQVTKKSVQVPESDVITEIFGPGGRLAAKYETAHELWLLEHKDELEAVQEARRRLLEEGKLGPVERGDTH